MTRSVQIGICVVSALATSRLTSAQTGQWERLSGLPVSLVTIDPGAPSRLFAVTSGGSADNIFLSTDGGITWMSLRAGFACPAIPPVLIDPRDSTTLYAATSCTPGSIPSQVMKSGDGGATWVGILQGNVLPLALDPTNPSILYAGKTTLGSSPPNCFPPCPPPPSSTDLLRSTDAGATWHPVTGESCGNCFLLFGTSPLTAGTIYRVVNTFDSPPSASFERSTDYGNSWTSLGTSGLAEVWCLARDPGNASTMFAGGFGIETDGSIIPGAFRSTDAGTTWTREVNGLPDTTVGSIAINPRDPSRVFAATDTGAVFASIDGGLIWADSSAGLDIPPGTHASLTFDPTGSVLYAASGNGLFALSFPTTAACTPDPYTLCLQNGRFQVSVQWSDFQGNTGVGTVASGATSNESGVMWFFGPDNWELLIKVLDGCGVNGHHWVFGAAATNIQYTIQVTDTQTGEVKTYSNPLGTTSPAITDTAAFAACP